MKRQLSRWSAGVGRKGVFSVSAECDISGRTAHIFAIWPAGGKQLY